MPTPQVSGIVVFNVIIGVVLTFLMTFMLGLAFPLLYLHRQDLFRQDQNTANEDVTTTEHPKGNRNPARTKPWKHGALLVLQIVLGLAILYIFYEAFMPLCYSTGAGGLVGALIVLCRKIKRVQREHRHAE